MATAARPPSSPIACTQPNLPPAGPPADEWWPFAEDARQRYRRMRHPAIIPHEQLLCDEALALAAQRQRQGGGGSEAAAGEAARQTRGAKATAAQREEEEARQAPGNALAFTFVGVMRRLNHCRAQLEAAGAVPLAACPADSPASKQSLHCCKCQQSVYAASAVLEPMGPPASWRHMCLECAAAAVASKPGNMPHAAATVKREDGGDTLPGGAAAAAAQQAGGHSPAAAGQRQQAAARGAPAAGAAVVFVKPCWPELEACARELEQGLEYPEGARRGTGQCAMQGEGAASWGFLDFFPTHSAFHTCPPTLPADTPLALPLAGTTAEARYGPRHRPAWPSPCDGYTWRPLQQPRAEWPATVLQALHPAAASGREGVAGAAAAAAVPTPDAVALQGAAAGAAVSPEAAFQVALQHEVEQAAAATETTAPPAGAAATELPPFVNKSRSGRRRGRPAPGDEDDADALEALPLESEATIEVGGHPVQRHIHTDGGERGGNRKDSSRGLGGSGRCRGQMQVEAAVGLNTAASRPGVQPLPVPAWARRAACLPTIPPLRVPCFVPPAGQPVLVGSEALEAVLGGARDKKMSAAK